MAGDADGGRRRAADHLLRGSVERGAERWLERAIDEALPTLPATMRQLIEGPQALRGVGQLSAATLVAEVGSFARFAHPRQLMRYSGAVPSEWSSGAKTARGKITKTGNAHLRRVLIEAAWAYRHRPTLGPSLRRRQASLDPALKEMAWKAQHRLCARYRRLTGKGKPKQHVITAVARERCVSTIVRQPLLAFSEPRPAPRPARAGGVQVVAAEPTDWQPEKAVAAMENWLVAYPDLNLVYGNSDGLTVPAAETARAAGRDDIIFVSVDGSDFALEAIQKGLLASTFLYAPEYSGYWKAWVPLRAAMGEDLPDEILIKGVLVNGDNVDQILQLARDQKEDMPNFQFEKTLPELIEQYMGGAAPAPAEGETRLIGLAQIDLSHPFHLGDSLAPVQETLLLFFARNGF